jgi:IclR family pca regulon transcriptional regulator
MAANESKKEFLDALANGLQLIESFDEHTRSVTIQSAAEMLGLSRSAARRVLLTLAELGYLKQDDRFFALAPKSINLGYRYFRSLGVAGAVKPHLHALSRSLNVGVAIGILDGADVLFIERVEADRPIRLDLRAGDRLPAYAHSLGRILLAQLPSDRIERHLPSGAMHRISTHTVNERDQLLDDLTRIQERGWSFVNSELVNGLFGVAIALPHVSGVSSMGLNVTSIGEPWSLEEIERRIVPALHECARAMQPITEALT